METVIGHFWNRWRSEYLTSLREHQSSCNTEKVARTPELNDIVLVKEDKLPRHQWRLGRVSELIRGRDGKIRAVKLLIGKNRSSIDRPINLVYPIEFAIDSKDETRHESNVDGNVASETNLLDSGLNEHVNQNESSPHVSKRPRRKVAVSGEIKRKLVCEG